MPELSKDKFPETASPGETEIKGLFSDTEVKDTPDEDNETDVKDEDDEDDEDDAADESDVKDKDKDKVDELYKGDVPLSYKPAVFTTLLSPAPKA